MFSKIRNYFAGARQEFKHIQWPTAKATQRLTLVVIGLSLVVAVYLGAFDFLFTTILQRILGIV
ncbi:MAG: preprotein translocase subunit SecE [Candidatus Harrisonbacteria bacterium CG10_big_fil_rev_8_21_14_0_10_44_23]|uniref:Protein translocase subunit SecE n=1 Tax=Candidatus Harrisonbacteria bacterium CG10_big_fil_rev_8_21_14_0_10_44_23 TaxID=1974585 RepID=A0A2H0UQI2_9BACT|nr:MAG: preprotein translocase subunit SecE [Candidatus Harrisonbacteria bacterium CG10_big_fil_rev_8_21_14_0_10_44_23]